MSSLGWSEQCFLWAAGYPPVMLGSESVQDREPIAKLGGATLFSAAVALVNWGIGSLTYAAGLPTERQWLVAVVAATMGVSLVLVVDRGVIYLLDTAGKVGRARLAAYMLSRIIVVLGHCCPVKLKGESL